MKASITVSAWVFSTWMSREKTVVPLVSYFNLSENDFRGNRFASHNKLLKGCNDILNLTKPDVIEEIHQQYLENNL